MRLFRFAVAAASFCFLACAGPWFATPAWARSHHAVQKAAPAATAIQKTHSVDATSFRVESLDGSTPIKVNGSLYRGAIELSNSGGIHVVNDVSLEDYIKGIGEMPNSWPTEALRAQAIAARTYVLWQLQSKPTICATDSCQVYAGVSKENQKDGDRWVQAVNSTAGQVLLYKNKPIKAMYSSSDGGMTKSGAAPYLKAVPDPEDAVSPLHSWTYSASVEKVASASGVSEPVVSSTYESDGVHIVTASGETVISASKLRSLLNGSFDAPDGRTLAVPSPQFSVSVAGGQIVLSGSGYGHGIGMSQYGAMGKAQKGWTAEKILSNYYSGINPSGYPATPSTVQVDLGGESKVDLELTAPYRIADADGKTAMVGVGGTVTVGSKGSGLNAKSTESGPNVTGSPVTSVAIDSLPSAQTAGSATINVRSPFVGNLELVDASGSVLESVPLDSDHVTKSPAEGEMFRSHGIVPVGESVISIPALSNPGTYSLRVAVNSGGADQNFERRFRMVELDNLQLASVNIWNPPIAPIRRNGSNWTTGLMIVFSPCLALFAIFQTLRYHLRLRRSKPIGRYDIRLLDTPA